MDEHFVETAPVWTIGGLVTEMPFAKNGCRIPCGLEYLCQCRSVQCEALAFENRMSDTIAELVSAGHKGAASGGASGTDVKIDKSNPLPVQSVYTGRLEDWVTVTGHIAVTLVVGKDKDDVRSTSCDRFA